MKASRVLRYAVRLIPICLDLPKKLSNSWVFSVDYALHRDLSDDRQLVKHIENEWLLPFRLSYTYI